MAQQKITNVDDAVAFIRELGIQVTGGIDYYGTPNWRVNNPGYPLTVCTNSELVALVNLLGSQVMTPCEERRAVKQAIREEVAYQEKELERKLTDTELISLEELIGRISLRLQGYHFNSRR